MYSMGISKAVGILAIIGWGALALILKYTPSILSWAGIPLERLDGLLTLPF